MAYFLGNNLLELLGWLAELIVSSYFLSYGAEHLAQRYGARFVGRTLLSIVTTLPEIAIVVYAASEGSYGTAIGAGLGSNLLMMTLGLALMLLVATTRLSKVPLKGVDVSMFRLDKIFLLITAVASAALFVNGYSFIDGIVFAGLFITYLSMAFREMTLEAKRIQGRPPTQQPVVDEFGKGIKKEGHLATANTLLAFGGGAAGIFVGAAPFVHSLQGLSADLGISVVVLAVVLSPIAGEMPEKISMILLARKGAAGASIAVANVLGSKILNNTLLLAVAVFGAVYHGGFGAIIGNSPALEYQVLLVTGVTILALIPMFQKEIGLKVGMMLAAMYVTSIAAQFVMPQDLRLK